MAEPEGGAILDDQPILIQGEEEIDEEFAADTARASDRASGHGSRKVREVGSYEGHAPAPSAELSALKVAVSQLLIAVYALWRVVKAQGTSRRGKKQEDAEAQLAEIKQALITLSRRSAASWETFVASFVAGLAGGVAAAILVRLLF